MVLTISSPTRSPRNTADDIVAITPNPTKSLAQQLPAELVSLIASYLVPSPFRPKRVANTNNLTALFAATHVCRTWRAAIFNDPRLWTKIEFRGLHVPQPHYSDMLAKVLTLSGSLSLDVTISFIREADICTKMFAQILDASTRCASLSLTLPYDLFTKFVRHKECQFPRLRRLSLMSNPDRNRFLRMYMDSSRQLWYRLPMLEDLKIMLDMADWIRSLPPNDCFRNLKKVTIETSDIPGDASRIFFPFIDMLRSSNTIASVTFEATCCESDSAFDGYNRDPVSALNTSIETLNVTNYGVRLLYHMSLPSLRNLSVNTLGWNTPDVPEEVIGAVMPYIIGFLDRSNPPLEKFSLAELELTPSTLPSMLHYLRHVTSFSLCVDLRGNLSFLAEFFDELSKNHEGTFKVLPHLKRLVISLDADVSVKGHDDRKLIEEVDEEHFVQLVRERTSYSDPSLRYVAVTVDANGCCNLGDSDCFERV